MKEIVERLRFLASGQDDPHSVALDEAANEIERQFNQAAALIELADMLRKDAARYQWLRNQHCSNTAGSMCVYGPTSRRGYMSLLSQDAGGLDAAIDAAIKVSGG